MQACRSKQLNRKSKPNPLMCLIRGNSSSSGDNSIHDNSIHDNSIHDNNKNSGVKSPVILNSIRMNNDPYVPHIYQQQSNTSTTSLPSKRRQQHPARRSANSSTPHLVTHSHRPLGSTPLESPPHHHQYFSFLMHYDTIATSNTYPENVNNYSPLSPPLSPPALSPSRTSFSRPSWREIKRSPTWQPASSISSSEEDEDDDDDEPIGLLLSKPVSLLSDTHEDGDEDLIPIAQLSLLSSTTHCLSAAEKYKAKVKARLQMEGPLC